MSLFKRFIIVRLFIFWDIYRNWKPSTTAEVMSHSLIVEYLKIVLKSDKLQKLYFNKTSIFPYYACNIGLNVILFVKWIDDKCVLNMHWISFCSIHNPSVGCAFFTLNWFIFFKSGQKKKPIPFLRYCILKKVFFSLFTFKVCALTSWLTIVCRPFLSIQPNHRTFA